MIFSRRSTTTDGRLVLGFDASCARCSRVAAVARRGARGRLEVMGLRDPQMQEWLGGRAENRPVLVRVTDAGVEIATGPVGLPRELARQLGVRTASGVLLALARSGAATPPQSGDRRGSGTVSRRTVLGGVLAAGGLAVAAGVAELVRGSDASAAGPAPLDQVVSTDEISALRGVPEIATAEGVFGRADWDAVRKGWNEKEGRDLFLVPLGVASAVGTTHLVTSGRPGDTSAVALRTGAGERTASVALDCYTFSGRPMVSMPVAHHGFDWSAGPTVPKEVSRGPARDGVELVSAEAPLAPEGPSRAFINCFTICLQANGAGDAVGPCLSCVNAGSPMDATYYCGQCAALAGPLFRQCTRECAGFR